MHVRDTGDTGNTGDTVVWDSFQLWATWGRVDDDWNWDGRSFSPGGRQKALTSPAGNLLACSHLLLGGRRPPWAGP